MAPTCCGRRSAVSLPFMTNLQRARAELLFEAEDEGDDLMGGDLHSNRREFSASSRVESSSRENIIICIVLVASMHTDGCILYQASMDTS